MTDTINFIHDGDTGGTLVEVRGNLIVGKYLRISDMKEMLRLYNGHYKKQKGKGQEKDYWDKLKEKPIKKPLVCSLPVAGEESCSS